jgi:predicted ester cyclase
MLKDRRSAMSRVEIVADNERSRKLADLVVDFFFEVLAADAAGKVDDFLSAGFVDHDPAQGTIVGRAGVVAKLKALWTAFPDGRFELLEVIAAGDRVAARSVFTGMQNGAFGAITPTGKTVRVTFSDWYRIEGGLICEHWHNFDDAGFHRQVRAVTG